MFRKPRWEYHQIVVSLEASSRALDDLGGGGWEAYAVFPNAPMPITHLPEERFKIVIMLKRKL